MIIKELDLKSYYATELKDIPAFKATLYLHEDSPEIHISARPTMIVCPGGGYGMTSDREAEPIAMPFYVKGYQVAVIRYSVAPEHFPVQLLQGFALVKYLRENAEELRVRKDKIAAVGFSAGGHFAGMLTTLSNDPNVLQTLNVEKDALTINAGVLCYPVLLSEKEVTHGGTMETISGGDPVLREYLSIEKRVTKQTPPCFLWHTANDELVPIENSIRMAAALAQNKVPFELHIYEDGPHGMATSDDETGYLSSNLRNRHVESWIQLALDWLTLQGFVNIRTDGQ